MNHSRTEQQLPGRRSVHGVFHSSQPRLEVMRNSTPLSSPGCRILLENAVADANGGNMKGKLGDRV
jgi:hypothetical protein